MKRFPPSSGPTPLKVTLSLASELEPPCLLGTPTGMILHSGMSVMGLTRLSARWKGTDDSSNGWMTLHPCKQKCKHPSVQALIGYISLYTLGLGFYG
jgi:hypothetical protein